MDDYKLKMMRRYYEGEPQNDNIKDILELIAEVENCRGIDNDDEGS
jgi:hypothetical protein